MIMPNCPSVPNSYPKCSSRGPSCRASPDGRITRAETTDSRMCPYLKLPIPGPPVATQPATVENRLDGVEAVDRPKTSSADPRSAHLTPGWTRAVRFLRSISSIWDMGERSRAMPFRVGNVLTVPMGNVLTARVGKVLDIYRRKTHGRDHVALAARVDRDQGRCPEEKRFKQPRDPGQVATVETAFEGT